MAGWFGHTQTLTSISKSVSTVASGILGLEDNLATFMKKVHACVRAVCVCVYYSMSANVWLCGE